MPRFFALLLRGQKEVTFIRHADIHTGAKELKEVFMQDREKKRKIKKQKAFCRWLPEHLVGSAFPGACR